LIAFFSLLFHSLSDAGMANYFGDQSFQPMLILAAGLIVSLAKQEHPDTSAFDDPEVVWRMNDKPHHIGLIVRSPSHARVGELLASYVERVRRDHLAVAPPKLRPAD